MKKHRISIVVPAYNRSHCLSKAIESVQKQNNSNWELIIVDDGSTDRTEEIVKTYLKDNKIKYFYQPNKGVSEARNLGAKKSTGDYLIFLDSDDRFFSELIQNLYDTKFWEYDLICWQVLKIIEGKKSIWKPKKMNGMYNQITASFLAGSICYRKKVFIEAGGYDPKMSFGENYELGLRVGQLENLKIKILNKTFLKYEINIAKRSSNSVKNRLISYLHQYRKHKTNYNLNPKAKAKMNYLLGFVLEKSHKKTAALAQYKKSLMNNPWRLKPYLKVLYLKLFR